MAHVSRVDNAIKYAEYGWKVYPLIQSGKIPHKGSNGHLDASNDPKKSKGYSYNMDPLQTLESAYWIRNISWTPFTDLHAEGKSYGIAKGVGRCLSWNCWTRLHDWPTVKP